MKEESKLTTTKWDLLRQGNEKSFYDCFHICYDDLYRLGLLLYKDAQLVKDCIHLTFIELWKIKDKLDEVNNIKAYASTIFRRILYKQKSSSLSYWSKTEMIDAGKEYSEVKTLPYEELLISAQEEKFAAHRIAALLEQLTERQKELIRMRYFEEKSIDEIAGITFLTSRTIYNTLHNALSRLKALAGAGASFIL